MVAGIHSQDVTESWAKWNQGLKQWMWEVLQETHRRKTSFREKTKVFPAIAEGTIKHCIYLGLAPFTV